MSVPESQIRDELFDCEDPDEIVFADHDFKRRKR